MGAFLPQPGVTGPGIGGGTGVAPLLSTPSDPLAKLLLPVPAAFCSAGLEVPLQREESFRRKTQQ